MCALAVITPMRGPRGLPTRLGNGSSSPSTSRSNAAGLRVRQNFNPGAILQVDLIDVDGGLQTVFSGIDTTVYTPGGVCWFQLVFPPSAKRVERVRIGLDSVRVRGWNSIDAVQLLAAPTDRSAASAVGGGSARSRVA